MGAWIETNLCDWIGGTSSSHPVWVRGLKLVSEKREWIKYKSHPVWVRGLKPLSLKI